MSAELLAELATALRERINVIDDREWRDRDPATHLDRLKSVSERIAQLQSQLPADIDPQLRHFLTRCSYEKALAWIEDAVRP